MGCLLPCRAKHLLRPVLSTTPGNFLAEKTVKTSEKHEARTGAFPVLTRHGELAFFCGGEGTPTLTNEKRRLLRY